MHRARSRANAYEPRFVGKKKKRERDANRSPLCRRGLRMYQGKSGNDIGVSTLAAFARAGRAARGLRWRIGALAGSRDRQTRTSALDNDGGCVISEGNDASSSISNIGKVGAGECRVFRGRFVMDASLERCGDCITARREALPDPAIHRSRD
jgi:hypothetical protein